MFFKPVQEKVKMHIRKQFWERRAVQKISVFLTWSRHYLFVVLPLRRIPASFLRWVHSTVIATVVLNYLLSEVWFYGLQLQWYSHVPPRGVFRALAHQRRLQHHIWRWCRRVDREELFVLKNKCSDIFLQVKKRLLFSYCCDTVKNNLTFLFQFPKRRKWKDSSFLFLSAKECQ